MKYIIGIDLGTSGTKTVLFAQDGTVVAAASREYPMAQPRNGWAEQNPEDWWQATAETLREVMQSSCVAPEEVAALGISGQMHGLVMLDADGEVLRPAILWCDQRTGQECEEITDLVGRERLIEITANPALTGFTASKIMWVKKHEPEIFAQCKHILLPKDYLRYRLSGDFATEMSDASGMQLLDVSNRCWSQEILDKLGIDPAWLGKLYESPEITGTVYPTAARATGLSPNTLIVGGAGDNAAAAVGTGVVAEGQAFTTIGTSGVVYAHTGKPVIDPGGRVHTFCCAVPGAWHVMGVTQGAGLSLQWFRNQFCEPQTEQAAHAGTSVYQLLDEMAGGVPIGAEKLLYLPYLMGERTPHLDPDCRGAFFGLSAIHTRAHCLRAILEGVSYSLYDCLLVLAEMGIRPETMLATGGGGKSALWRQMFCDVFDIPVQTAVSGEGPALGAAVLAAVGAGLYPSVPAACEAMVKRNVGKQMPLPENTEAYRAVHRCYRNLYPALKESFAQLAAL